MRGYSRLARSAIDRALAVNTTAGTAVRKTSAYRHVYKHPMRYTLGAGAVAAGIYGLPNGNKASRQNQGYASVRNMRRAQSSAQMGVAPKSMGGYTL